MKIGAERIQGIVKSLRVFSRMDEAALKEVDIHEGIDSTLVILQHRFKSKDHRPEIEIRKQYGVLPLVECYAGQLNQVFMNIISNAVDALEEAFTQNKTLRPEIRIITRSDGDIITIDIIDNGPGIPKNIQERLFNPFFTTKPIGKGTGMGLSISHQIVTAKHGGKLSCFTEEGQGTTFRIQIPLTLVVPEKLVQLQDDRDLKCCSNG
ncbi:MAG: ATP-binding protein [Cyanobacteria bacterium P01_A01_bin.37]